MCSDSTSQDGPRSRGLDTGAGTVAAYAAVARHERAAALRVLAAQFAHQIRNGLAATRAVFDNLRLEIESPDHRQRLKLALNEIDRLLDAVTSTVQSLADAPEAARQVEVVGEVQEAIALFLAGRDHSHAVRLSGAPLRCALPPMALRVAILSLLDHLLQPTSTGAASVELHRSAGRLQIRVTAAADGMGPAALQEAWPREWPTETAGVALLVAGRLARDLGGGLKRSVTGDGSIELTLELPLRAAH